MRRLLPFGRGRRLQAQLEDMPAFAVPAAAIKTLDSPVAYREQLLAAIAAAERRIVIVALYLEDDDGGREVLEALYAAKAHRPALDIAVFVDWHRAQRGLIGKARSEGNAGMYRSYAAEHGPGVACYGVPVQNRELFGVLHLKGYVVDDTVIYSGASLNDVYLARHGRYRLDRYHVLDHAGLADAMAGFVAREFAASPAVCRLDQPPVPTTQSLLPAIRAFRQQLQQARYAVVPQPLHDGQVAVTPLVGFGRADNPLNATLLALLRSTRERVVLLTPYFNLPRPVRAVIGQLLRRGCQVEIMVGDKVAARLGGRLRYAISGGAALPVTVSRMFIGLGIEILQGYGLTETSPIISVNRPGHNDPASVGEACRGIEVKIGDNDELLVMSPGIMLGYWNNHAATAEVIDPDGWLHTGDQARIENGNIYITGRLKDILVLSNGEKIPPTDMESAICFDPLFEQALVVGEGRPCLGALVVLNPDLWFGFAREQGLDPFARESLQDSRLQKKVLSRIQQQLHNFPGYARIRRVHLELEPWTVDNGLLTPTLKIKRAKVLEQFSAEVEALYE